MLLFGWLALNVSLLWGAAFVSLRLLYKFKQKYPDDFATTPDQFFSRDVSIGCIRPASTNS